jgi:hypothetical protein
MVAILKEKMLYFRTRDRTRLKLAVEGNQEGASPFVPTFLRRQEQEKEQKGNLFHG